MESGLEMLAFLAIFVMAVEDPHMSAEKRKAALEDLQIIPLNDKWDSIPTVRSTAFGDVKYTLSPGGSELPLTLSAKPFDPWS